MYFYMVEDNENTTMGVNSEYIPSSEGERITNPASERLSIREPQNLEQQSSHGLREINITPLNSGYIVRVGCQTVAVEETSTLITVLQKYLENPDKFETNWMSSYNQSERNKLKNFL